MIDCSNCEHHYWDWVCLSEETHDYDEWIECSKEHNTFPDECKDYEVLKL